MLRTDEGVTGRTDREIKASQKEKETSQKQNDASKKENDNPFSSGISLTFLILNSYQEYKPFIVMLAVSKRGTGFILCMVNFTWAKAKSKIWIISVQENS